MKQTSNYQLNQWEKTDRILMEDFNGDNAKVDAALKAQASDMASLAAEVAKCGNCRVVMSTYTGTGAYNDTSTTVSFSEMPLVFMIVGPLALLMARGGDTTSFTAFKSATASNSFVSDEDLTWTGNAVSVLDSGHARYQMNEQGCIYWVLALYKTDGTD